MPRHCSGPMCPDGDHCTKVRFDFAHFRTAVLHAQIQTAGSSAMKASARARSNTARRCPIAHSTLALPQRFVAWLWPYLDDFSGRTRSTVASLTVGTVLAGVPRTVTNLLHTLGLAGEPGFAALHRVLRRNRWSGLKLARTLLNALDHAFVQDGPVVIGVDHTLERRRRAHVHPAGHCFDSVRSSTEQTVTSHGLRWMSAMLLVEVPFADRSLGPGHPAAPAPPAARSASGRRHGWRVRRADPAPRGRLVDVACYAP